MYFHYPSFLLGLLCGIVFVIFVIYLVVKLSIKTDEELFRKQKLLDNFPEEDIDLRK